MTEHTDTGGAVDTGAYEEPAPTNTGDNWRRAGRSLLQFGVALVLGGVVTEIWNSAVASYEIDPFLRSTISLLLGAFVVFVQNQVEDATGKGVLIPKDRLAGGALLNAGIGAKTTEIVGDTNPYVPTVAVKKNDGEVLDVNQGKTN